MKYINYLSLVNLILYSALSSFLTVGAAMILLTFALQETPLQGFWPYFWLNGFLILWLLSIEIGWKFVLEDD